MDTDLFKLKTYCKTLPLKPYDPLIKNFKNLYFFFHKTYGHWTWQGVDFEF